jgi:hypothetical protein
MQQGPNHPRSGDSMPGPGSKLWINPGNVVAEDGNFAHTGWADGYPVGDGPVRLVVGGAPAGADRSAAAPYSRQWQWHSFGGPADAWGLPLTPADVNDPAFGVAYSARSTSQQTEYLYASGFGFSVPDGAVIDGVLAEVLVRKVANIAFRDNDPGVDALRVTVFFH